ncbi:MAG: serine/threonine protein kinase [Actinobacteria bacterium]|nr:serine/threonine protein kinase [Actinomycetota bacterium]
MKTDLLLNRYKLIEEPVREKFADVFRAYDTQMERLVLIKKIKAKPKTAYRAIREAHMASLIKHPNILQVYEFLKKDNDFYLTFELVEGLFLSEILKTSVRLKVSQAIAIAVQICLALESVHLNNIIHRNITPSTIKILPSGRVKLTNLGTSRLLGPYGITPEGDFLGTIPYMSPEQLSGELIDSSTDIFSLGVVLYEMLTTKLPFEAETDKGLVFKILNSNPVPPAKMNSHVPEQLSRIILKSLEKSPENRFPNIVEFRYKLERFLPPKITPALILKPLVSNKVSSNKSSFKVFKQLKIKYVFIPFAAFVFNIMAIRNFSLPFLPWFLLAASLLVINIAFSKVKKHFFVFSFLLLAISFLFSPR